RSFGFDLCAFVLVDLAFEGEEHARDAISALPEVQEMHHISGPHSYLLKVRVRDTAAMQDLLQHRIKPLAAVLRTESIVVFETVKESTELALDPLP
ncbi:MAG TPA: Lrp/AsnC ligand binding domain-containing protein, partial [Burkholderiaceae bacterium]